MNKLRLLFSLPLVAALVLVTGCTGGNKNTPAKLSGKVTYKNAPVTGGTITFFGTEAGVFTCDIKSDGSYGPIELPIGDVAATVETESINPNKKSPEYKGGNSKMAAMYGKGAGNVSGSHKEGAKMSSAPEGATPGSSGTYVKIPPKYTNRDTAKLKATLIKGDNKQDFDLTD